MAAEPDDPRAAPTGTPALAVAPPPEPDPAEEAEAAAWAAVVAAWDDEEAHRAYLARPLDLDGLALAGRRYRAVLAERPGDAIATRCRDEVVQRAMVQGLASIPRSAPPRRVLRWILIAIVGAGSAVLVGWAATTLFRLLTPPTGALP
jgi:hypothetical protein